MTTAIKFVNENGRVVTASARNPLPVTSAGGGQAGASAYELAVQEGYEGSLSDWLESLNGEDGDNGAPSQSEWADLLDDFATLQADNAALADRVEALENDNGDD